MIFDTSHITTSVLVRDRTLTSSYGERASQLNPNCLSSVLDLQPRMAYTNPVSFDLVISPLFPVCFPDACPSTTSRSIWKKLLNVVCRCPQLVHCRQRCLRARTCITCSSFFPFSNSSVTFAGSSTRWFSRNASCVRRFAYSRKL